jgi:ADP-ribose pyrophosphatase YjhB (NUDIX family)
MALNAARSCDASEAGSSTGCGTPYEIEISIRARVDVRAPPPPAKANIQCANCGGQGHVYRICNHPISSFGVICYRVRGPLERRVPEYLVVQRKDSLCYVEFIRGKYSLPNRGYIAKLLSNMTQSERERIRTLEFDALWYGFWQTDQTRTFMKEYEQSKTRFNMLRSGYYLRAADTGEIVFWDMSTALAATTSGVGEPEFGFPKGRRNINESDLRCACREFREESGIDLSGVSIVPGVKPFEEVFTGSNRVRYRHVYYLAQLKESGSSAPDSKTAQNGGLNADVGQTGGRSVDHSAAPSNVLLQVEPRQQKEIRALGWFGFDEVVKRIRAENVERREMFRRVHQWVVQSIGRLAV